MFRLKGSLPCLFFSPFSPLSKFRWQWYTGFESWIVGVTEKHKNKIKLFGKGLPYPIDAKYKTKKHSLTLKINSTDLRLITVTER